MGYTKQNVGCKRHTLLSLFFFFLFNYGWCSLPIDFLLVFLASLFATSYVSALIFSIKLLTSISCFFLFIQNTQDPFQYGNVPKECPHIVEYKMVWENNCIKYWSFYSNLRFSMYFKATKEDDKTNQSILMSLSSIASISKINSLDLQGKIKLTTYIPLV